MLLKKENGMNEVQRKVGSSARLLFVNRNLLFVLDFFLRAAGITGKDTVRNKDQNSLRRFLILLVFRY
jgi:hypothetical protein